MRRLLVLTCAMIFVDTVFYATLVPLVPYFTEELGLSKSAVGALSGAFGAGVLLGSAPSAYLTARGEAHGAQRSRLDVRREPALRVLRRSVGARGATAHGRVR